MGAVKLALRDSPPTGVTLISFSLTLTGVALEPGDVPLLSEPTPVEIGHLQAGAAMLGTAPAKVGSYSGIRVTLTNPRVTLWNNSGAAVAGCANGDMCDLAPSLATSTLDVSAPSPLSVALNKELDLMLDLDLAQSLSSTLTLTPVFRLTPVDFLIDPTVLPASGVVRATSPGAGGVPGVLTFINYDIQTSAGAVVSFLTSLEDTLTTNFPNCGSASSCSVVGQSVDLRMGTDNRGGFWTDEIVGRKIQAPQVKGIIAAIPSATQFDLLVIEALPSGSLLAPGQRVRVNLAPGTTFAPDFVLGRSTVTPDSTFTFAGPPDLLAGQTVEVSIAAGPSGTPATITTDRVVLTEGAFTGTVQAVPDAFTIVMGALGGFPVPQMRVGARAEPFLVDFDSLADLRAGDTISAGGLLFKTAGDPVLVAARIRKR